jgi:hypothetical protein
MKNIKIITVAFFIGLLCLNSDCNKVEETPSVTDLFIIEGRLVNSCTDSEPIKLKKIDLVGLNYTDKITTVTDSDGYFKFYSKFKDKKITLFIEGSKTILDNLPGSKNLNLSNVAYNLEMPLIIKYKSFSLLTVNDSILIYVQGVNPTNPLINFLKIKGPLSNENLGTIYLNEASMYSNQDSIKGEVILYKNNYANLIGRKRYLIVPCGINQEIIFE